MAFRELLAGTGMDGAGGLFVPTSATTPFADNAARDVWGAANLTDLVQNQTVVVVTGSPSNTWYLWRGATSPAAYDNANWSDVSLILEGRPGPKGDPGVAGPASNLSGIPENSIPAAGAGGVPKASGLTLNPTTGDISTEGSIQTGPGSIRIGPQFTLSNGVRAIAFTLGNGSKALGVSVPYTSAGSENPSYYRLDAEHTLNLNRTLTATIPAPFSIAYQTQGDHLTVDFDIVPAEAGDLRVRFWQGTDNSGTLVFDETMSFAAGTVGTPQRFNVGNPYIFPQNTQLFAEFSGIQLRGGVAGTGDILSGQTTIYFVSHVHGYTLTRLAEFSQVRTDEQIQDLVGAMFTDGSHTGISFVYDDTKGVIDATVSATPTPTPTMQYKVFTQATTTVTEAVINAVSEEGSSLPYRVILTAPQNNMVVAWHSTTDVSDIHVNVLDAGETTADISTGPLGNRFLRSAVQTAGAFQYQIVNIGGDIGLLTAGQRLGIYVG